MPEMSGSYVGYYFMELRKEWERLRIFWRENATHNIAYRTAWNEIRQLKEKINAEWNNIPEHYMLEDVSSVSFWFVKDTTNRVAGPYMNIKLLLEKGIKGLIDSVKNEWSKNSDTSTHIYYNSLVELLEFFSNDVIGRYEKEAKEKNMDTLSSILSKIKKDPPSTLYEAMQLAWLYILVSRVLNIGRMDVWFGPFLAKDLKENRINLDDAQRLVDNLWKIMY
jgi:Pyruvate-formate lyase